MIASRQVTSYWPPTRAHAPTARAHSQISTRTRTHTQIPTHPHSHSHAHTCARAHTRARTSSPHPRLFLPSNPPCQVSWRTCGPPRSPFGVGGSRSGHRMPWLLVACCVLRVACCVSFGCGRARRAGHSLVPDGRRSVPVCFAAAHICAGTRRTAAHICAGTGLTPAHICSGTRRTAAHICAGTGLTRAHICAGTRAGGRSTRARGSSLSTSS